MATQLKIIGIMFLNMDTDKYVYKYMTGWEAKRQNEIFIQDKEPSIMGLGTKKNYDTPTLFIFGK